MTKHIQFKFEASVSDDDKATLYLHGTVGGYWEGINFNDVRNALASFQGNEIEVHINSYGGDMFEGIAIKNFFSQRKETVTVIIDGLAASAASIIAMGADKILMPKDTQLMIHNPWTFAYGNAKELRKVADDLEKAQVSVEETYLKRFKGDREELKALLDEETFLTADEAVTLGLADGIYGEDEPEEVSNDAETNVLDSLMAKYGTDEHEDKGKRNIERFAFLFTQKRGEQ